MAAMVPHHMCKTWLLEAETHTQDVGTARRARQIPIGTCASELRPFLHALMSSMGSMSMPGTRLSLLSISEAAGWRGKRKVRAAAMTAQRQPRHPSRPRPPSPPSAPGRGGATFAVLEQQRTQQHGVGHLGACVAARSVCRQLAHKEPLMDVE